MITPPVSHWHRHLTPEQATEQVGERVPDLDANVTEAVIVADATTGQPAFAYLPIGNVADLRRTVLDIPYSKTTRAAGWQNTSRTFGYAPRRPVYGREGCENTRLWDERPDLHTTLLQYGERVRHQLQTIFPDVAERDAQTMANSDVKDEWRLGETNWTSGVVNRSSSLPYHRDGFNFPVWTAMPVLRRHMRGGYLHIPEYNAVVASRDGWAVFFPGYELVHGVTPMTPTREGGYRYSVVYYALKGMKDCFTHAVEQDYALKKRTEREQTMAAELAQRLNEPTTQPHR